MAIPRMWQEPNPADFAFVLDKLVGTSFELHRSGKCFFCILYYFFVYICSNSVGYVAEPPHLSPHKSIL